MFCMSQWHCDQIKPLLVRLGSLGTASGTRPHRCTPISVPLVVVQTRPDIRIRVRRIVIRIRVRHTAIRIRVVVAAIDHTAYGSFHLEKMNFPAKVLIFNEATEKSTNFDGLTPVFLDVFRSSDITLYAFFALRFVASLPFSAYAASANALNAATLSATTILPRKARRDPIYA